MTPSITQADIDAAEAYRDKHSLNGLSKNHLAEAFARHRIAHSRPSASELLPHKITDVPPPSVAPVTLAVGGSHPITEELVEKVARIISPEIWKTHDEIASREEDREWLNHWRAASIRDDGLWGHSLVKARAVIEALEGEGRVSGAATEGPQADADWTAKALSETLVNRQADRFRTIAFLKRHTIIAALEAFGPKAAACLDWKDAKAIAASALQSACETDPADPDHPDTIMITTDDFETIVRNAIEVL